VLADLASSNPAIMYTVLALFFIGFATKAGVLPFGDWLPDAYPAAPSGASAAFAGTMSKLGIYGMLRVIVGMVPTAEAAVVWGIVIAIFGTASIFFGTLAALAQDDSKRLMSFHVIGQIGYMMLGIGVGLCLLPSAPVLGALAMIAGTFHLINNVCYKSCLLMNAGSVLYRTGTRDLNRVGGLSQLMPWTAATAAVAALSIAGVPPLSGFASKWMIYASTITAGIKHPLFLILALVALFVSLVTLASFLKFFGSAFLGKLAGGKAKEGEREVPFTMVFPQAILALLCVLFGLVPVLAVTAVYHAMGSAVTMSAAGFELPALSRLIGDSWFGIQMKTDGAAVGAWIPLVVLAALVACLMLAIIIRWLGGAPVRQVASWYGGEEHADELVRGRAHGFVLPFKKAFAKVYPQIGLPHWGYPRRLQQVFDLDSWLYARGRRESGGGD